MGHTSKVEASVAPRYESIELSTSIACPSKKVTPSTEFITRKRQYLTKTLTVYCARFRTAVKTRKPQKQKPFLASYKLDPLLIRCVVHFVATHDTPAHTCVLVLFVRVDVFRAGRVRVKV